MLQTKAVSQTTLGLLRRLNALEALQDFGLVGGTNLALRYGHRLSVDLDFFTSKEFYPENLVSVIERNFRHFELLFQRNRTIIFDIEGVRVDFVQYPFKWLYDFEVLDGIRFAHVEDIIPMKIQGLENRKSKKDFWDIACLLQKFSIEELFAIVHKKFPFVDIGHLVHSFTHFEEADLQPDPIALNEWTWDEVKNVVSSSAIEYTKGFLR
jgi:predicted nucleotidyltransferase component of viral defense system